MLKSFKHYSIMNHLVLSREGSPFREVVRALEKGYVNHATITTCKKLQSQTQVNPTQPTK